MDLLEKLREKNPALPLYSVFDPTFSRYGCVLELGDCAALAAALEGTERRATATRLPFRRWRLFPRLRPSAASPSARARLKPDTATAAAIRSTPWNTTRAAR